MRLLLIVVLALILAACATVQPVPVKSGDNCYRCREPIVNLRLATEFVDANGRAYKFKCPGCIAAYLAEHAEEQPKAVFVTDYPTGKMLRAESATFVRFVMNADRNQMDFAAFRDVKQAMEFAKEQKTAATADWPGVLRSAKAN